MKGLYFAIKITDGFPGGSVVKNPSASVGWSLIQEDPTCLGATGNTPIEPVFSSPGAATTKARVPKSPYSTTDEATAMRSPCSPHLEKSHNKDPA